MSAATRIHPPTAFDLAVVNVIVDGAYTPALLAIGTANLPTLQVAAQRCTEAEHAAIASRQPHRQYQERALHCRARIRSLFTLQRAAF